ncbi:DNA adenine methylase [Spiroplasma floricola]|uniref:site-specific DNA-methyltransferase (adenine-specific) n=1 Tax=Spiroplasma floricola 23-6 TaxID=1336749 RepID=A0A2K8SEF0_9MOLU|nr:DNA adenine methylase [Spiroplasma floricola]AUB31735.1 adenine-specific DNA-methyltransferase [Spiroplasma floricola 23-6]
MKYNNRRYIGNKNKLTSWIFETIEKEMNINTEFIDIFAGTGAVGFYFAEKGYNTILNDNLFHNYVIYRAFNSFDNIDQEKLSNIIDKYNNKKYEYLFDNYISEIYGNRYFSKTEAFKIGEIREDIEKKFKSKIINEDEKYYLITSLMFGADKIANTVGHYESFLNNQHFDKNLELKTLFVQKYSSKITPFNMDANLLIKNLNQENSILYLDPPYNARQYINFYHVLENIAIWNKPTEFQGKSMKFLRDHLKSEYSRSKAKHFLKELINSSKSKVILMSYNNTYNASSTASNNKITEQDIIEIFEEYGKVEIYEKPYKSFNSGKTNFIDHKEILYVCKRSNR